MSDKLTLSLVLQLHRPRTYVGDTTPAGYRICAECRQAFPCETVSVIEGSQMLEASDEAKKKR